MDNQKSHRTFLQNAAVASLGALVVGKSVAASEPAKLDVKILGEAGVQTAAFERSLEASF